MPQVGLSLHLPSTVALNDCNDTAEKIFYPAPAPTTEDATHDCTPAPAPIAI